MTEMSELNKLISERAVRAGFYDGKAKVKMMLKKAMKKALKESIKILKDLSKNMYALVKTKKPASFGHLTLLRSKEGLMPKNFKLSFTGFSSLKSVEEATGATIEPVPNVTLINCPPTPTCKASMKYRTIDGSCNNLEKPKYGMTDTVMSRILTNAYFDGFIIPRGGFEPPFPSARKITITTFSTRSIPSNNITALVMHFGQFLDHDISHIPVFSSDGEELDCCTSAGVFTPLGNNMFFCFPIKVPDDDPVWPDRKCLNFVRSITGPRIDCLPGPAEQLNQLTHWLDSSIVYGSEDDVAIKLRAKVDGLLRVQPPTPKGVKNLLPINEDEPDCKAVGADMCFLGGDLRVNEQPNLAVLHTIFVRFHNYVAEELKRQNPSWDDERLYQEARRVNGAVLQHIIYAEWLPVVLGPGMIRRFGLKVFTEKGRPFSVTYSDQTDPRATNEFATAALRFGHSVIPTNFELWALKGLTLVKSVPLSRIFFVPDLLYGVDGVDQMLKGMTVQKGMAVDPRFTTAVLNELFALKGGLDLLALNVQRGRDHGLQSYIFYQSICAQTATVTSFEELIPILGDQNVAVLRTLYSKVQDIDLFIGLILETFSTTEGLLPLTLQCIIGDQFARLRKGDRFFYDLKGQVGSFTQAQLDAIRVITFSRVACDTTRIEELQPNAFIQIGPGNELTLCSDTSKIPMLDLSSFKGI